MGGEGKRSCKSLSPAAGFDLDGSWLRDQGFHLLIKKMVELGIMPRIVLARAEEAYCKWKNREGLFAEFVDSQVRAYQDEGRMRGIRVFDVEFAAHEVVRECGKLVHVFTEALHLATKSVPRQCFIISGSPVELVREFAASKEVYLCLGTEHPREGGFYTGGKSHEWVSDKKAGVEYIVEKNDLNLGDMTYIGDSMGDVPVLRLVSHPICINPEHRLTVEAAKNGWPVIVEKKDMLHMYREWGDGRFEKLRLKDFLPQDLIEPMAQALSGFYPNADFPTS
ncbi:MAG: haloacid dehalogenase-like hydrolase [Patescibacteria group bacterium]